MKKTLLFFLMFTSFCWAQEEIPSGAESIVQLSLKADFECFDFKVLGICPKPNRTIPIGIKVRYWQPEAFVETVKNPGDYVIREYGVLMKNVAKKISKIELESITGIKSLPVSSGSSSNNLAGSSLQFNEAHIYDFPLDSFLNEAICSEPANRTLGVRYLSEADSIIWRRGDLEKDLPESLTAKRIASQCHNFPSGALGQCMKNWGTLYPRQGFVITPSMPVGSVISVVRSMSIAAKPLPAHIVESSLNFQPNLSVDRVQMVYPQKTVCFPIGQNPSQWEMDKQSKEGSYVWIYWHQRQCCI